MIRRDRSVTLEVQRAEIKDSIARLEAAMPSWTPEARVRAGRLGTLKQLAQRFREAGGTAKELRAC